MDDAHKKQVLGALTQLLDVARRQSLTDVVAEAKAVQDLLSDNEEATRLAPILREVFATVRPKVGRVVYLGPEGSFSQAAIQRFWGSMNVQEMPQQTLDEVFDAVEKGCADYAVVPIENSTEGSVSRTMDLLRERNLFIRAETSLKIHHSLLNQSGLKEDVRVIYAHPQAAAQCRSWLVRHFPHIEIKSALSNAQAALQALQDAKVAGIASAYAADLYQLRVMAKNIQDRARNQTRFLLMGVNPNKIKSNDFVHRTTLILAVKNQAGALYHLLTPLAENDVSMTRFESRPAYGGNWEYFFYMDIEGARGQPHVDKALQALQDLSAYYKNLGTYPLLSL